MMCFCFNKFNAAAGYARQPVADARRGNQGVSIGMPKNRVVAENELALVPDLGDPKRGSTRLRVIGSKDGTAWHRVRHIGRGSRASSCSRSGELRLLRCDAGVAEHVLKHQAASDRS